MNINRLKTDLKALSITKQLDDVAIDSAIHKAGMDLAWHIDISELNVSATITVVSGTVDYEPTVATGGDIDRITSAIFVGSGLKQPLNLIDINTFYADYYGAGGTGTPYECVFYENKLWLYYIPNLSGTVYLRMQKVFNTLQDLGENYYSIVFVLAKMNLVEEKSKEREILERERNRLISTYKGRVRPYKQGFELSPHRE